MSEKSIRVVRVLRSGESDPVQINAADFDPARHKLWEDEPETPVDPEPAKNTGWGGRRVKGKGRG